MTCLAGEGKEAGKEVRFITTSGGQDEAKADICSCCASSKRLRAGFCVNNSLINVWGRLPLLTLASRCPGRYWEHETSGEKSSCVLGFGLSLWVGVVSCCHGLSLWFIVYMEQRRQEGWKNITASKNEFNGRMKGRKDKQTDRRTGEGTGRHTNGERNSNK